MTDYVSRETALNFTTSVTIAPDRINAVMEGMALYAEHIKAIPAADVVEVVHARWIKKEILYCSECDMPTMHPWPYCQKCGAKMDGGVTDA